MILFKDCAILSGNAILFLGNHPPNSLYRYNMGQNLPTLKFLSVHICVLGQCSNCKSEESFHIQLYLKVGQGTSRVRD